MDLLLILTYAAIVIVIFKVFKIPLNKWSVPTAVLGGVLLIGTLIFVMNYNHPYSEISRQYFVTTPIVPSVSGRVIEVPVKGNTYVKQGDVLFKIDPTPFAAIVRQKEAALAEAIQASVPQLKSNLDIAEASLDKVQVEQLRAKQELDRFEELVKNQLAAQREVDRWQKEYDKWSATVLEASARRDQASIAIESEIGGENTLVARLRAELDRAQYDLDQTVVRAPTDGFITQLTLRPGTRAVAMPLRPVMIFVHDEAYYFVAWFRQNSMLRLKIGDEAEVAFDGIPGKVFSGEIEGILPVLAEGQVQASGEMMSYTRSPRPGRIPVLINITDPDYEQYADKVPGGAYAQTAIYTEHFHHVAIMRKVLLRMSSWMNYLFPFH